MSHHDFAYLHSQTKDLEKYTSYTLHFFDKIYKIKVTTAVKCQDLQKYTSYAWYCTPTPPANVPSKIKHSAPSSIRDIAQTSFQISRSLQPGKIKITPGRSYIYNPQPMSLPSINFPHLTLSEIQPWQNFKHQGQNGKVKGQIKITPWCCILKLCNQYPSTYQHLTTHGFWDTSKTSCVG